MLACKPSPNVSREKVTTFYHTQSLRQPVLGVVRMIKLFGWEPRVAEQVAEKRQEELGFIKRVRMREFLMNYMKSVPDASSRCLTLTLLAGSHLIPLVTMIVTYAVYVSRQYSRKNAILRPRLDHCHEENADG